MQYEFRESDAEDFARQQGLRTRKKGKELHLEFCPYCRGGSSRDKWTFAIELGTGVNKCLRDSCGVHGNMITLAKDFDFNLGDGAYMEYIAPKKQYRTLKTPDKPIEPKDAAIEYLKSRGISEEVAKRYEITVQNDKPDILVFPFYDENGVLQFVKYRNTKFKSGDKFPKEWCEKNTKPILFGMKQCDPEDRKRLWITEGQMDSLSLAEIGIKNVVSVPTGSKGMTWIPYCWDFVNSFDEIVVFGDLERSGEVTLLKDICSRFKKSVLRLPEASYGGFKDANDILLGSGRKALQKACDEAQPICDERVLRLADVKKVDIWKLPKMKTGIKELDRLLRGGLFFGQVCIIAGKRGDGKSTFSNKLIAEAIDQGYPTFVYSGELNNYLFKSWLDFQIAGSHNIVEQVDEYTGYENHFITNTTSERINEWYRDKVFLYDSSIVYRDEHEDLLETIENTVQRYGIKVVVVDNLMTAIDLDASQSSDKWDKQSDFMKRLVRLAVQYDLLVLLVAHRRKSQITVDTNDEISGSADITNLASVVMSYDRDKDLSDNQRRLVLSKSRIAGRLCLNGIILNYEEKSKRVYSIPEEATKRYGWEENFHETEELVFD